MLTTRQPSSSIFQFKPELDITERQCLRDIQDLQVQNWAKSYGFLEVFLYLWAGQYEIIYRYIPIDSCSVAMLTNMKNYINLV